MIIDFLNNLQNKNIAIIGDIVLDEYYEVNVQRISPEFPIPVLQTPHENYILKPGGAANVAAQFHHFNVNIFLLTFLNEKSLESFINSKINNEYSVFGECKVPVKKRYYDKNKEFPLCRIDVEQPNYGLNDMVTGWRNQLIKQFKNLLSNKKIHAVICSDYNKGLFDETTCQEIIKLCNNANIPTIVDPKACYTQWKNCTIFKPNEKELFAFTQNTDNEIASTIITEKLNCSHVVATFGGKGVSIHSIGSEYQYVPFTQTESRSVIGAGDCFIAFLAMSYVHDYTMEECVYIAFHAASLYVKNIHNQPVTPQDLKKIADPVRSKIITPQELVKCKDTKYVFTNGCFDILHVGHIETLRYAKSKGDKLIVGLNTDESVSRLKGKTRPILTFEERSYLLASLEFVDYVIGFNEDTPHELINKIEPDVLVKGGDYTVESVVGTELVNQVYLTKLVENKSTTNIIKKIKDQFVAD
jgi:D-beta-D-heptose 7-phosphate kinase/D-beta-D-heptose 1-phosphate adenosyltransferase